MSTHAYDSIQITPTAIQLTLIDVQLACNLIKIYLNLIKVTVGVIHLTMDVNHFTDECIKLALKQTQITGEARHFKVESPILS